MMRLSQVARILNVGITTIVDHLSAKGYKVETNPNTKINADQIEFLAKDFKSNELRSSLTQKPAAPAVEAPAEVKEDKVKSDVEGILYFRNTPKAEEKPVVEEKPSTEPQPAYENKLPGIKVVGKIDLDAKRPLVQQPASEEQPKPEAVKEVVAEAPKPAPAPVEKEEVKPVAVQPEPVKQTPAEAPVKEAPVAPAAPVAQAPAKEEPRPAAPVETKPAPAPVPVEPKETAPAAEKPAG